MDPESIAHEAKGLLVGQKRIETKHLSLVKTRLKSLFVAKILQTWPALFATKVAQPIKMQH